MNSVLRVRVSLPDMEWIAGIVTRNTEAEYVFRRYEVAGGRTRSLIKCLDVVIPREGLRRRGENGKAGENDGVEGMAQVKVQE